MQTRVSLSSGLNDYGSYAREEAGESGCWKKLVCIKKKERIEQKGKKDSWPGVTVWWLLGGGVFKGTKWKWKNTIKIKSKEKERRKSHIKEMKFLCCYTIIKWRGQKLWECNEFVFVPEVADLEINKYRWFIFKYTRALLASVSLAKLIGLHRVSEESEHHTGK